MVVLYSLNYAKVGAMALDPIEKKPLYHFYPGSQIFSLGTSGCNLSCGFCQNWQLARAGSRDMQPLSPRQLLGLLQEDPRLQVQLGVAYTYAEPSVWYEYIRDCAPKVKGIGKKNVLVTNGYINPKPLEELLPYIDAMNIDVKAFNEDFYHRNCAGSLKPVLETVKRAVGRCHVEVTCLLIPGENDSLEEISGLARWLGELGRDIPLHFTRYFPSHKMSRPPTPPATLYAARKAALKYLNYVYVGNMAEDDGSNTFCPCCNRLLIKRTGYSPDNHILDGFCPECGHHVADAFRF
jgi:pyruvate formate lyase activating enzyme